MTKNGEVAQRLFVHEKRYLVCAGGPQNEKRIEEMATTADSAVATERIFDLVLRKIISAAWELGQSAFENNSIELFWALFNSNSSRKSSSSITSNQQQLRPTAAEHQNTMTDFTLSTNN